MYLLKTEHHALVALSNKDTAATLDVWHRKVGHRSFYLIAQGQIQIVVTGLDVKHGDPMALKGIIEEVC